MAKIGRPTRFNAELAEKVIVALQTGVSIAKAARHCGVSADVVRQWMARNKDFNTQCKKAQADKEVLANRKELESIKAGDMLVIQKYLDRLERQNNHRVMQAIRYKELESRAHGGLEVVPAVIDFNEIVKEIESGGNDVSEPSED